MPLDVWRVRDSGIYVACREMILACGDELLELETYDAKSGGVLFHQDMPKRFGERTPRCHALLQALPHAKSTLVTTLPALRRGIKVPTVQGDDRFARLGLNGFWWDDSEFGVNFKENGERLAMVCSIQGIVIEPPKLPLPHKRALIMIQKFTDSSVRVNMPKWVYNKCEYYLDRGYEVIARTHPSHPTNLELPTGAKLQNGRQVSIFEALKWATLVVAHTSTSAVDAVIAGVPVKTDKGNMAAAVSAWPPAREQLLNTLAHTQWQLREMKSGRPWDALRKLV
ncbi:MAG: hypothetical protein ACYTEQ_26875 [Planctomycetota bacterium]